jgi:hypothetical protein
MWGERVLMSMQRRKRASALSRAADTRRGEGGESRQLLGGVRAGAGVAGL